jgi:two-component system, OmpR family, response regulator VanR
MSSILLNKSVLIAEDDIVSNNNLTFMLQKYFKRVISSYSGEEAYTKYLEHSPDIIFTDIEMPKMNGLQLAEKIRHSDNDVIIIVMTSFTNEHYLLKAVNMQLLSYIVKPITRTNFKNTIEKIEKKFLSTKQKNFFFTDKLYYDYAKKVIVDNQQNISLTHQEISLLEEFIRNKNVILSNDFLEEVLEIENSNALKLAISRLRKKLPPKSIQTVYAEGYILK